MAISPLGKWGVQEKVCEKNKLLTQPQRMLISSFQFAIRTTFTSLFIFSLNLGLQCTQIHRFVQYIPLRCFNSFAESAVNDRTRSDKNPQTGAGAKMMKLLVNSLYGYQIMDGSQHTFTKHLNDEKAFKATNRNFSTRLIHLNNNLYDVESLKAKVHNEDPIIAGSLILQHAKLSMLVLD